MTSAIKDKLFGSSSDSQDTSDSTNADKYLLKVYAGTSYNDDTRNSVIVNGTDCVVNDQCKVAVRIRDFQGLPGESEKKSAYFNDSAHAKDTYSIAFNWAPEEDVSAEDLVWGIEAVNPIGDRIPKNIITTAFSMVKRFVDSSLDCDPYVDQPWVNGAILCGSAMTFRVGEKSKQVPEPVAVLQEGADGDGVSIRQDHGIPDDEAKRRKFFGGEEHRKDFKFEKGRCYQFDFHNGYIDWKNYALKLPGFSLSVLKWINDRTHTVRFVMKNRNTGTPYLIVTFRLLFGKELDDTLKNASQNQQPNGYTSTNNAKVAGGGAVATKSRDGSKHDDSNRSPAENSSHADPRAQGYVQTEPREGQSNSQLEPQNNVQKDSKEDHHTAESHSQEPDSRNMDEESRAISTKRAEKTDTENSDKNDREDAKQGSVVTNEHPDETPNRKDEMQDKTHHESQTHGQEVSNDNHHGLPLRRAQAASEYVNDESNGVGVVPAETQPFAFTEQPLISKPIADDTGVEAPTQASEQQDGDVQPRQGYRHSIEEILCQTASIDGRDKLSSVLK